MKFSVILEPRAHRQLKQTVRWISERSQDGANRWLDAFDRVLDQLEINPQGSGLAPENSLVNREIRQTLFKSPRGRTYRVVFTIREPEVHVLAIRGPGHSPLKRRDLR